MVSIIRGIQNEELLNEINKKSSELEETKTLLENQKNALKNEINPDVFEAFNNKMNEIMTNATHNLKWNHVKKLNRLYEGTMYLSESRDNFINLSNHNLTKEEKEVLNLGLNCHIHSKIDQTTKKMEIEILYQNLIEMENKGKVIVKRELSDSLRNEGNKNRANNNNTKLLTKKHKEACKNLRSNLDIIIRKADKSQLFVILNREDYCNNLDNILSDETKFEILNEDPSEKLKKKLNTLVNANNAVSNCHKLPKLVGEYHAGYINYMATAKFIKMQMILHYDQ